MRKIKHRYTQSLDKDNFYRSRRWRNTRQDYINTTDGLCEWCLQTGRHKPGKEVHHIEFLKEFDYVNQTDKCWDFNNLVFLCRLCHDTVHNRNKKEPAAYFVKSGFKINKEGEIVKNDTTERKIDDGSFKRNKKS